MNNDFKPVNLLNIDFSKMTVPQLDLSYATRQAEEINAMMDDIAEERERKEANEEAYRQETIRSLHAIEQNTANLWAGIRPKQNCRFQSDWLNN